jgi:hypothetical protein
MRGNANRSLPAAMDDAALNLIDRDYSYAIIKTHDQATLESRIVLEPGS